jgi:hypothetical protein
MPLDLTQRDQFIQPRPRIRQTNLYIANYQPMDMNLVDVIYLTDMELLLLLTTSTKSGTCSRLRLLQNCRVAALRRHGSVIVHGSYLQ